MRPFVLKVPKVSEAHLGCLAALAVLLAACGCRARVIHVQLTNTSSQPLSAVVVDYPKATFGVNSLPPGGSFRYAIKPTEAGAIKVEFVDAHGSHHAYSGSTVAKGQEGNVEIRITQDSASMTNTLR